MLKASLFLLLFFGAAPAQAVSICAASVPANGCWENQKYVQAASDCLQKIRKTAEGEREFLRLADEQAQRGGRESLAASEQKNLARANAALTVLLDTANRARMEMALYTAKLDFPGGVSQKTAEGLGLTQQLIRFPCFSHRLADLQDLINDMDDKIAEIGSAAAAVSAMNHKSELNQKGMAANPASKMVTSGAYGGGRSPSSLRPRKHSGASDITGTEKAKDPIDLIDSFGGEIK